MGGLTRKLLGDNYVLRRAIPADAMTVLRDIRKDDIEEWAMSAVGGVAANLYDSIKGSKEAYTVASREDNAAHITFGVFPVGSGGPPHTWLLGTNQGQRDCYWILQECREFYREFFQRWPHTVCYSAVHNTAHHRWLEWMDYVNNGEVQWGAYGLPFYEFERKEV